MEKVQKSSWRSLWSDNSGLALIEFAFVAPLFLGFVATGTELANYTVKTTQVSQLALQVADNGARIGEGEPLALKRITEGQINDLFLGAEIHSGTLDIFGTHDRDGLQRPNGRIILSSLETVANPNPTNKYRIAWQRCRGQYTKYTPQFGEAGQPSGTNIDGMGPVGRQVTAVAGTPVLFVEVRYRYQPLFLNELAFYGYENMTSTASMMVRDARDLSQVYPTAGQVPATCVVPLADRKD